MSVGCLVYNLYRLPPYYTLTSVALLKSPLCGVHRPSWLSVWLFGRHRWSYITTCKLIHHFGSQFTSKGIFERWQACFQFSCCKNYLCPGYLSNLCRLRWIASILHCQKGGSIEMNKVSIAKNVAKTIECKKSSIENLSSGNKAEITLAKTLQGEKTQKQRRRRASH